MIQSFSAHGEIRVERYYNCFLSAGLSALPGGVKFPDSAGAFHYEESGKLLSVTSNRFIHWSVTSVSISCERPLWKITDNYRLVLSVLKLNISASLIVFNSLLAIIY